MYNTDETMYTETRNVNIVDRNLTSCGFIMVILLLLVAIMLLRYGLPASGIKGTTSYDNCQW